MQINVTVTEPLDLTAVIGTGYDDDGDRADITLGDRIAEIAARNLAKDDTYWRPLKDRVTEMRTTLIRELVQAELAVAMEAEVQRTNALGEPIGPATTLRELIVAEAKKWFTEKHSNDYGRTHYTNAQSVVAAEVNKAIKAELAAAIAEEKAKVVAAIQAKAAELIADAVKQGVGR